MAHEEKLPWELTEEILSRVPPNSLVRFRTVSKQWNALFDDKTFINNHKTTFRFILTTKSNIYSVSIDPKIEVRKLTFDIPGLESQIPEDLVDCDKLLLCNMEKGAAIWNPWLRQGRWIYQDINDTQMESYGIGYDNEGSYTIVVICDRKDDFASDAWKDHESVSGDSSQGVKTVTLHTTSVVSLNEIFYWVTYNDKTDLVYQLSKFNSSSEFFFEFCDLPCGTRDVDNDVLVLSVFKGDRFSLLKQCHATKKIEIWASKHKINNNIDSEDVEWIKFMDVSSPNLPDLVDTGTNSQPSYFIEDKRLVVCSCDETGRAWIYVLEENKLISKTHIDSVESLAFTLYLFSQFGTSSSRLKSRTSRITSLVLLHFGFLFGC